MIEAFTKKWEARQDALREQFAKAMPDEYKGIVTEVVRTVLHDADEYDSPDPERITEINHGDYQGTLLYVVAASGYQPSKFWAVCVNYGSCSHCDTFQAILDDGPWDAKKPNEQQLSGFMKLALHVVQEFKEIE